MKANHNHDGVYRIDYYAYMSQIRGLNSSYKVLFGFLSLLFCIILDNVYVSLSAIIIMGFITVFIGKLNFKKYVSLLKIPFIFMILASITVAISISHYPYGQYNLNFHFFYIYTTNESILDMFYLILKAFGAVSSMYMITLSTPASEIICVLKKIHVPEIIIELMNMIYRFIFILMDSQGRMKNAAESRLGYSTFKAALHSFGNSLSNLLIVSLKKADSYYMAAESRCYDGTMHFIEEDKRVTSLNIILFSVYFIFLIALKIFLK